MRRVRRHLHVRFYGGVANIRERSRVCNGSSRRRNLIGEQKRGQKRIRWKLALVVKKTIFFHSGCRPFAMIFKTRSDRTRGKAARVENSREKRGLCDGAKYCVRPR